MRYDDEAVRLFVEEAQQLIESVEAAALELEADPGRSDLIAETFRFLHTFKGAAAMYGFNRAADIAHEVETVFDAIRRQRIAVPPAAIHMSLVACDVLGLLVTPSALGTEAYAAEVLALRSLIAELGEADLADSADADLSRTVARPSEDPVTYMVRVRPDAGVFRRGVDVSALLADLTALGASAVALDASAVPPLDELDPEACHLAFDVRVTTNEGIGQIEAALMFLGPDEYTIEVIEDGGSRGQAAAATFKGGAGTELEGRSVRVSSEKLDVLVDLVGEIVVVQEALAEVVATEEDPRLLAISEMLERLTSGLRESVLRMRMVPIGTTFSRFRRHVRDLATELGKQVSLVAEGGDTQLDKSVIERIEEPLVHVIRNALDHGIEPPDIRACLGKPPEGTITLSAFQEGGHVFIRVTDDGAGPDAEALRERAAADGLLAPGEQLSPERIAELVCVPGFTTASRVTSVSGRGVGLDVVKRTVESLQGSVDVRGVPGRGMSVTLRLPLTLAIVDGLLVSAGRERYILPLVSIEECFDLVEQEGFRRHGRNLVDVRGQVVPFVRLRDYFAVPDPAAESELALVLSIDGQRLCVVVDWVIDRVQTVIKTLGRALRGAEGVSGATVLGDGRVALVVDMGHLLKAAVAQDEGAGIEGAAAKP